VSGLFKLLSDGLFWDFIFLGKYLINRFDEAYLRLLNLSPFFFLFISQLQHIFKKTELFPTTNLDSPTSKYLT